MAVAMRKKRAWSTRADDAESQETAAFEASVAAAKDTAAKSGAFLSDAKSDLTDHQRWLSRQSAAVERDRQRHERWLQRQRDYRLTAARKERQRRRRQLMRQRAFLAVRHAIWAGMLFVQSWFVFALASIWAGIASVGRLIARSVTYVANLFVAGLKFVAGLIAGGAGAAGRQLQAGAAWMFAKLGVAAHRSGAGLSARAAWTGAKARASAQAGGSALASGSSMAASKAGAVSRVAGRSLGSGLSVASAKTSVLAGSTGQAVSRGLGVAGKNAAALQAAGKKSLANGWRWTAAKTRAITPALYVGMAKLGRQAERSARAGAARTEGIMARASAKASKPAALYGSQAEGAEIAGHSANDPGLPPAPGAQEPEAVKVAPEIEEVPEIYGPFYEGFWVEGVSPNEPRVVTAAQAPIVSRGATKNALSSLSSWAHGARTRAGAVVGQMRSVAAASAAQTKALAVQSKAWAQTRVQTGDVDLSRMMIIAGAVLLVCGGLLVGGGLLLRSGGGTAATPVAEEEPGNGIVWAFQETDRSLPERAVFTLSGSPASFRINGLSVGGTNLSDQPLTAVEAVLKPDVKRPDLKLTLEVDTKSAPAGEGAREAGAFHIVPEATVPAGANFRLVFAFPPEAVDGEDGITVEEYFESYGGLLLKLRYEIDGTQKSLIQYLPPDLLKAQLDEVSGEAAGG